MAPYSNIISAYLIGKLALSMSAFLMNGSFLIALVKRRSLHTPSNTVLGCLCSSDLLLGLISFALSARSLSRLYTSSDFDLFTEIFEVVLVLTGLSSLFMILVNVDRYTAICHPYRYLRYATNKLYTIIFILTFLVYAIVIIVSYVTDGLNNGYSTNAIIMVIISISTLILMYCTFNILRVVRRHRREIAAIERCQDMQHPGIQIDIKRSHIVLSLVILFTFCKLPNVISYMLIVMIEVDFTLFLLMFAIISDILHILNSLLNPLVFYFRLSIFRCAMKDLFRCQRQLWSYGNLLGFIVVYKLTTCANIFSPSTKTLLSSSWIHCCNLHMAFLTRVFNLFITLVLDRKALQTKH